jgi:hypothetical protein
MKDLLPLLRRFTTTWEQNVVLGDHRWESENINATQRFAKGFTKELLKFNSKYSDLWDAEVRDQIHLLSNELRQFVTSDMRHQSNGVIVAHGRTVYELTRGLVSHLEAENLTRRASNEH